jgi:hypothetical protein
MHPNPSANTIFCPLYCTPDAVTLDCHIKGFFNNEFDKRYFILTNKSAVTYPDCRTIIVWRIDSTVFSFA